MLLHTTDLLDHELLGSAVDVRVQVYLCDTQVADRHVLPTYVCDRRPVPAAGAGEVRQRMLPEARPRRRNAGEL